MMCLHQLPVNGGADCKGEIRRLRLGGIGPIPGRLLPNTLPNSNNASGIYTHALRLVMPAIGAGLGVLAQRSGALAVWAAGEPILVYRRAANEPSPALSAAQRQSQVRVPADGPLRDARKGHWATVGPLSLRLPTTHSPAVRSLAAQLRTRTARIRQAPQAAGQIAGVSNPALGPLEPGELWLCDCTIPRLARESAPDSHALGSEATSAIPCKLVAGGASEEPDDRPPSAGRAGRHAGGAVDRWDGLCHLLHEQPARRAWAGRDRSLRRHRHPREGQHDSPG